MLKIIYFYLGEFSDYGGIAHKVEDLKLPCISAHRVSLKLMGHKSKASTSTPIVVTLPHAFNSNSGIVNVVDDEDNHRPNVELTLLKVVPSEPWPTDFTNQLKWCLDRLPLWRIHSTKEDDPSDKLGQLNYHIRCQYNNRSVFGSPFPAADFKKPPMDTVRSIISSLFKFTAERKDDKDLFLTMRLLDSTICTAQEAEQHLPDLFVRIHPPVRVSPLGLPLLAMSVFDQPTVLKLVGRGKINSSDVLADLKRIYTEEHQERTICLMTYRQEESSLLRSILHANAARITPSAWQKKHLPLDIWIPTFVSPLYTDQPAHLADVNTNKKLYNFVDVKSSLGLRQEVLENCARCSETSRELKRCARCKKVLYCSVECQRSDWPRHKSICHI